MPYQDGISLRNIVYIDISLLELLLNRNHNNLSINHYKKSTDVIKIVSIFNIFKI